MVRDHLHLIIRAYVTKPPKDAEVLSKWCTDVISLVGMNVIGGPIAVRGEMEGNKGLTCVAVLDFSHISIHTWDEDDPALIEFDLFSCKTFDSKVVIEKLKEFGLETMTYLVIDRNDFASYRVTDDKFFELNELRKGI